MKKLLIATTALVATGSMAAAEVSVGGTARAGYIFTQGGGAAAATAQSVRTRINFSASGETDGGLTFGAATRINAAGNAAGTVRGSNVFIGNDNFTVTLGNTDGAVASTVTLYGGGLGFTGNDGGLRTATHVAGDNYAEASGGGAGPNLTKISGSFSGVTLTASTVVGGNNNTTEVGVGYSGNGIAVGLGTNLGSRAISASAAYSGSNFTVGLVATRGAAGGNANIRLYGTYTLGNGLTLRATAQQVGGATGGGIGVSYALGGGATAQFAVGQPNGGGTAASVGMNFSF